MTTQVLPVPLEEILPLREFYRQEMNCQIVHDSLPGRGFGNLFLLRVDGRVAGRLMGAANPRHKTLPPLPSLRLDPEHPFKAEPLRPDTWGTAATWSRS